MFTVADVIEALKKQRPDAELESLTVRETGEHGLELSGHNALGRAFRIVAGEPPPRKRGKPASDFPP